MEYPSEEDRPSKNAEDLEEIDFDDLGKLWEKIDAKSAPMILSTDSSDVKIVEERFTGILIGPSPSIKPASSGKEHYDLTLLDIAANDPPPTSPPVAEDVLNFYIDTNPTPISNLETPQPINSASSVPLGDTSLPDDDDVIVYVAPHPRSGKARTDPPPPPEPAFLPSTSILTGTTSPMKAIPSSSASPNLTDVEMVSAVDAPAPHIPSALPFESVSFSFTPSPQKPRQFTVRSKGKAKMHARREARAARKRMERQAMYGSFSLGGVMMAEAQLRGERGMLGKRDPRWEERRRGDSDVDWGDSEDDGEGAGEAQATSLGVIVSGAEGMDIDPELELDVEAMMRFANGMGADGGRFVTMDDLADEERIRREDEQSRIMGSSGDDSEEENSGDVSEDAETDMAVAVEEELLIAEPKDMDLSDKAEEDDSSDDDDTDLSPRAGFQARLERLRNMASEQRSRDAKFGAEDSSDDGGFQSRSWAEEDDDFLAHIEVRILLHSFRHRLIFLDSRYWTKMKLR